MFDIFHFEKLNYAIFSPNILNFEAAYNKFKTYDYFENIQDSSFRNKRLSASLSTGEFKTGEFDRQLSNDFKHLCVYDLLLKIDIKEYYGRLYTHKFTYVNSEDERYLSNMNLGATNGLVMGNYLSLYFAEMYLNKISSDIEELLMNNGIECDFSYFSDDFYFFCNERNKKDIIQIFDSVLEKHKLERNDLKEEVWNYESYNSYNLVERYWKKVMSQCNRYMDKKSTTNKLRFINQLVYRMTNLEDEKMKKVFINNFFKTKYFRKLDLEKFIIKDYDYHQLTFLFKYSPEAMLYSIDKFESMSKFENKNLEKFMKIRYKESLYDQFHDIQLFYFYAIKILAFDEILANEKDLVLKSKNQLLISYYLSDGVFNNEDIGLLAEMKSEDQWFQNFHLILYVEKYYMNLEESIKEYLIPLNCKKTNQVESYLNFYKDNLVNKKAVIRDINDVKSEIEEYLRIKTEEIEKDFNED